MRHDDYRADRVHAALLKRHAELRRLLELKNPTAPYELNYGYVFLIRGPERLRLEDELRFLEETLAILAEEQAKKAR